MQYMYVAAALLLVHLAPPLSDLDVETAKRLHVPSYIGVAFDHSVRRYDPTTDKVGLNVGTEGTVL